jgi:hypothetical protein
MFGSITECVLRYPKDKLCEKGQAQKCDGVILVNGIPPSSLDNYIQMYTNRYKPQKTLHRLISNQQKIPYCNIKSTT